MEGFRAWLWMKDHGGWGVWNVHPLMMLPMYKEPVSKQLNAEKGAIGSPEAIFGENIIIANLDTGVWPESKSFSGNGYGTILYKLKGGCENETLVPCNNTITKVIKPHMEKWILQ
ncbi:hypothetical protein L1987_56328 [Smallanthus sonchifolius]|uniref:Uncharacterized protein n=1 Tax=Smallanthus sonchifolius TaxID=185202 RepID=A0ACB9EDH0_9ASTR|nr:hypothetical protein L1987_56328 [Smallanthus sonchifolius]